MLVLKGLIYTSIFGLLLSSHAMANHSRFSAHYDNYLLPAYWESNVNQRRFKPLNPNQHAAKALFVQFQLSMKYKLLEKEGHGLFVAYSQRSNWEAYDDSAYFRDNQYNPELFYRWDNRRWQLSLGLDHQSNGAGGDVEVSWNRIYMEAQLNLRSGFIGFKPWIVVGDNKYNPDIVDFLGHGELQFGWRPEDGNSIVKLTVGNLFTKDWQNGFYRMSWDFPVYQGLRGYMKVETGYGLTISNYNFDDTAVGLGLAFDF